MKKSLLAAIGGAIAILCSSCSTEPDFSQTEEVGPYTVSLIQKDVWHIEDCNSSNPSGMSVKEDGSVNMNNCSDMYIIRGKKGALLIDLSNRIQWAQGADEALVKIFSDRAGDRQKFITITHNHGDHTGMLYAFEGDESISYLLPKNDFADDSRFPAENVTLIADNDIIDLGKGTQVRCVEVAGHTPGSMVFFLMGSGLCFSGDAIGSGGGVWIFSMQAFEQYTGGVNHLMDYINNGPDNVNKSELVFWGGHDWQKLDIEKLTFQYLDDMQTLIGQIYDGTAQSEPYSTARAYLNANFKYGMATITWNKEDSEKLQ